jgi:hypothetical protein
VNVALGWAVLVVSALLLVSAALPLRTRLHDRVVDLLLALGGAGIGVGGLLFLEDVGVASWLFAPAFLAVGAIAHVRALFGGAGPFRT